MGRYWRSFVLCAWYAVYRFRRWRHGRSKVDWRFD